MLCALSFQFSRRVGKLQFPAYALIVLLQRTPVVRLLATAESIWASSSFGQVLKASAVVATMMGAVDTLAGATTFVVNPDNPAEATVGVSFSAVFAYTGGAATVGSYSISNLPPGLSVPNSKSGPSGSRILNAVNGSITGTPTQVGDYIVSITAFDDPDLGLGVFGSAAATYLISVGAASTDIAPIITVQPVNVTVAAGQPAVFSVTATGSPAPTYQWKKANVNIPGATNPTYTIASTVSGDAGTYSVAVTNAVNSITSTDATLTVNPVSAAPVFTTQPQSQAVVAGATVTFTVAANGTPAPTFQWQKNAVNIPGANSSSYSIAGVTADDSNNYAVTATNASGSVTSNVVLLTVIVAPSNAVIAFTVE